MAGGIVMTSIGGVVMLSGVGYLAIGDTTYGQDYTGLGAGLLATGLLLDMIGIPLIVTGAKRVPRRTIMLRDVDLLAGPGSMSLRVHF
jgi:hypothetical protein